MDIPEKIDLAILGAVPQETHALLPLLGQPRDLESHGETLRIGEYERGSILIGTTGVGKVNAAVTTAALLQRFQVSLVFNIGSCGAYSGGPLQVGDVLVALDAFCGDEGVLVRTGLLSSAEIGFPILVHEGEEFYDHVPLGRQSIMGEIRKKTPSGCYRMFDGPLPRPAFACASRELDVTHGLMGRKTPVSGNPDSLSLDIPATVEGRGSELFRLEYGPSLTVGMVSGDMDVARERSRRYGAFAENMEGSAVAQACFRFNVPVIECRGVSNMAGNRNKADWQMQKAIAHCHSIVLNWLAIPIGDK